jgi:hypothetical protein
MARSPIRIRAMHLMAWETLGFDEHASKISLGVATCSLSADGDPESDHEQDYHGLIDADCDFLEPTNKLPGPSGSVVN